MKLQVITVVAATGFLFAAAADAQEALAKSSGCLNCHAVDSKKVGPALKDVAAKYKGKGDAEAMLVNKLSKAEGHPSVKASPDDTKALVKWVLSM